jgi:hypothetical protein
MSCRAEEEPDKRRFVCEGSVSSSTSVATGGECLLPELLVGI